MINKEKIKNNRIVRHGYYFVFSAIKKKQLQKKAEETLCAFNWSFDNEEDKRACINDMLKVYAHYGFCFDEYLYFHFDKKSKNERLAFVADWEHLGYTCAMNDPKNNAVFDNKYKTYQKFKKAYKRELLYFNSADQYKQFETFVSCHDTFIIKPLDMSCGRGIRIVATKEFALSTKWFEELLHEYNNRFIIEELIVQSNAMAKLHPASVNTVRVPTIRLDDETLIVNPFLRVGQGGNHVDNGGAGGIICAVDAETGKTFAAADENGNRFSDHPQTKEDLVGFQIPNWDEAKAFVRELAEVVPENRYTGWDIALTDNGWVLVEANRRGQFIWQIASQKGFRDEINSIFKKLGLKY